MLKAMLKRHGLLITATKNDASHWCAVAVSCDLGSNIYMKLSFQAAPMTLNLCHYPSLSHYDIRYLNNQFKHRCDP